QQATNMARRMVMEFGFSDLLGPLRYADNQEEVFLGHSVAKTKNVSEETADMIDKEVRRIIEQAETKAKSILKKHKADLVSIAESLLEYETLSGVEINALLRGEGVVRPDSDEPPEDTAGRKSSVPSGGSKHKDDAKDKKGPGMGAEPQPES
ncbi:MAG: cell division protein FtsH, partial [Rhodospirillales bacterium]|nr:cell division protein FtsH [Rhodospirillales bacterium]